MGSDEEPTADLPTRARPQGQSLFPPTRWSLVLRAPQGNGALGEWIGLYWYPLYAWARKRGMSPEDASDAVQGFMEKLCAQGLIARADATKGKLRSWLLASFSNYIISGNTRASRQKRGGGVEHVTLDFTGVEATYLAHSGGADTPERIYARTWALTLMDEALERVAQHYESTSRAALFAALLPALEAPLADATYLEVAARLEITGAALRQASVRMRQRYRTALMDIAATRLGTTCEAQLAEELRALLDG